MSNVISHSRQPLIKTQLEQLQRKYAKSTDIIIERISIYALSKTISLPPDLWEQYFGLSYLYIYPLADYPKLLHPELGKKILTLSEYRCSLVSISWEERYMVAIDTVIDILLNYVKSEPSGTISSFLDVSIMEDYINKVELLLKDDDYLYLSEQDMFYVEPLPETGSDYVETYVSYGKLNSVDSLFLT